MEFDVEIFEKMKRGNQSAFTVCYQKLSPIIYSTALRVCHCRAAAQDILQETFIQIFNSLDTINDPKKFIPWCKRISFNKTINWIRANNKHLQLATLNQEEAIDHSELFLTLELENLLTKVMLNVPAQTRLILWLYIAEGYTHEELAKLFNKSPSYSKSVISRTLSSLALSNKELRYAYQSR